jgi:hypothetical protein
VSRNHYAILIRVATGIGDSDAGEQQTFDEELQIESYLRSLFETPLSNAGVRIEELKAFAYARSLTSRSNDCSQSRRLP